MEDQLAARCVEYEAIIAAQAAAIARLEARIAELETLLADLQARLKQDSSNSSKPPSSNSPYKNPPYPKKPKSRKRSGGQPVRAASGGMLEQLITLLTIPCFSLPRNGISPSTPCRFYRRTPVSELAKVRNVAFLRDGLVFQVGIDVAMHEVFPVPTLAPTVIRLSR